MLIEAISYAILIGVPLVIAHASPTRSQMDYWIHVKSEGERYVKFLKEAGLDHDEMMQVPAIRDVVFLQGNFDPKVIKDYCEASQKYPEYKHTLQWPEYRAVRQSLRHRQEFKDL